LFAKRDDAYAGVDLANAARIGGAIWMVGAAFTAVFLPFAPPDEAVGGAGWVVAGAIIAAGIAGGLRLRALGPSLSVDELLAHSYIAAAAIAALVWLSGGLMSPYTHLVFLNALYTTAIHPPRRAAPFLVVFLALALAPRAYDDSQGTAALSLVAEVAILVIVAGLVMALMSVVRAQRLGLRREGERARRQARVDSLTGLLNRRAFDEALSHATDTARASGEDLSVLVGDLDGFKAINDRFGHLGGDRILCAVADSLRHALRGADVAYRWGGDEFALILPEADGDGAENVAERIRSAVAANTTPDGRPLGMATGIAQFDPADRGGPESLVAAADQALMRAKGSGPLEPSRPQG
jgi:diguanylate cyclase (GGDEF)-like protein